MYVTAVPTSECFLQCVSWRPLFKCFSFIILIKPMPNQNTVPLQCFGYFWYFGTLTGLCHFNADLPHRSYQYSNTGACGIDGSSL